MELRNLVSSLEYLVSNGRQVLLGGIRLGGSAIGSYYSPQLSIHAYVQAFKTKLLAHM